MKKYTYLENKDIKVLQCTGSDEFNASLIKNGSKEHGIITGSDVEIAPYTEQVKTSEQLKSEIIIELSSLDPTPRTLSNALLGEKWALDKLEVIESEKAVLREKLKSL